MAELIVTRLDPVSGEWEHNHAEGKTGSNEEAKRWLTDLLNGKVPEGKLFKWDKILEIKDDYIEVQNLRFGPYSGPDAGKLLHSIQRARISIIFNES